MIMSVLYSPHTHLFISFSSLSFSISAAREIKPRKNLAAVEKIFHGRQLFSAKKPRDIFGKYVFEIV